MTFVPRWPRTAKHERGAGILPAEAGRLEACPTVPRGKTLLLLQRPARGRVGVLLAHHVAQAAEDVLLEARVLPHLVAVAQRRVEDAALAVLLRPGQGVVLVGALAGLADRLDVHPHEDVQPVPAIRGLELVDLVG